MIMHNLFLKLFNLDHIKIKYDPSLLMDSIEKMYLHQYSISISNFVFSDLAIGLKELYDFYDSKSMNSNF